MERPTYQKIYKRTNTKRHRTFLSLFNENEYFDAYKREHIYQQSILCKQKK